jgi:hypothetical protein
MLKTCNREMLVSKVGRDTAYPDWSYSWFYSAPPDKFRGSISFMPLPIPSKSFQSIDHRYAAWCMGRAIAQTVAGFPLRRSGFDLKSVHVGCVVNEVARGQVFSEYFSYPLQFLFHPIPHIHLSSGLLQTTCEVPSFVIGLWKYNVVGKSGETVDRPSVFPNLTCCYQVSATSSKGQLFYTRHHLHT